ncbi:citrate lyase subunit beta/citryl-CoA lyase [Mesorhizobium sp. J18]|uniref:HpcH/HpaI aldolase/citrate lyase family protein n=1 Tax=Mesorhizobium sp. J18 TaxID=935263 RepID=UPI00119956C9|nr:CoA ester lyase [Mesorhizobium sp. J18]TWG92068.1 citrate lyase subunit beta/citryl-CoA lyase [Mesorhizobium sp. J18]
MLLRSMLFVPGDSAKKLAKGADSGADALILDLEDSVDSGRKPLARRMVAEYVAAAGVVRSAQLWVRINPMAEGGLDDIVEVVRAAPDGLVVPKVDHPSDLARLSLMLDALERRDGIKNSIRLMSVATETPRAPFGLGAYAQTQLPRLAAMTWGAEDLSTALGATTNRGADGNWGFTYRMVRSHCLIAAKACGVTAIETLYADFRDEAGLRADCIAAAREGFGGRIAIHPAQVMVINESFTPSDEDVRHAERVVAAFAASPGTGVVALDGKMLDIPHLKQAQNVLSQAQAITAQTAGRRG